MKEKASEIVLTDWGCDLCGWTVSATKFPQFFQAMKLLSEHSKEKHALPGEHPHIKRIYGRGTKPPEPAKKFQKRWWSATNP